MAIARVALRYTQNITTAATSDAATLINAAAIAVGNHLILRSATDYQASGAVTLTISDPRGNTWTVLSPRAAGYGLNSGSAVHVAWCRVANPYFAGDQITLNWGVSVNRKAVTVEEWSGISTPPVVVEASNAATFDQNPTCAITPTAVGQLVYTALSIEGITGTIGPNDTDTTGSAPWTAHPTEGSSAGSSTDTISLGGGWKVVGSTFQQNWNNALGVSTQGWAVKAVVFGFAPVVPVNGTATARLTATATAASKVRRPGVVGARLTALATAVGTAVIATRYGFATATVGVTAKASSTARRAGAAAAPSSITALASSSARRQASVTAPAIVIATARPGGSKNATAFLTVTALASGKTLRRGTQTTPVALTATALLRRVARGTSTAPLAVVARARARRFIQITPPTSADYLDRPTRSHYHQSPTRTRYLVRPSRALYDSGVGERIPWMAGQLRGSIRASLTDANGPLPGMASALSVRFTARRLTDGLGLVDGFATVEDALNAVVRYDPVPGDFGLPGQYAVQWIISHAGDLPQYVPDDGYDELDCMAPVVAVP